MNPDQPPPTVGEKWGAYELHADGWWRLWGAGNKDEPEAAAWEWFCGAHPHEAHAEDPEAFWQYFKTRSTVTREEMERLLRETDKEL